MKVNVICFMLIVLFFSFKVQAEVQPVLYNGASLTNNSFSWRTTVLIAFKSRSQSNHLISSCTGVFISRSHILTAAHCFEDSINTDVEIHFYVGSSVQRIVRLNSKKISRYGFQKKGLDLGIIALNSVIFPDDSYGQAYSYFDYAEILKSDADLYVVGTGREGLNHNTYSNDLVRNKVRMNFTQVKLVSYAPPSTTIDVQTHGKAEVCSGDSGGPVFHKDSNGDLILIGIMTELVGAQQKSRFYCGKRVRLQLVDYDLVKWMIAPSI